LARIALPHPSGVFFWSIQASQSGVTFCENRRQCLLSCPASFPAAKTSKRNELETAEESIKVGTMADLLNLAMLVCASVGSMAFGVLAAYGILRVGFALMRPQAQRAAVKARAEVARVL
jgi:hypothetical protein